MQDAEHVVERPAAQRVPRVHALARAPQRVGQRRRHVEKHDVGPGHHDLTADHVVELEHRFDQPVLGAGQLAVRQGVTEQGA